MAAQQGSSFPAATPPHAIDASIGLPHLLVNIYPNRRNHVQCRAIEWVRTGRPAMDGRTFKKFTRRLGMNV